MALASGLADIFTGLNDLRNAQINQELNALLNARDAEIAAADGNANEIAIIQEKLWNLNIDIFVYLIIFPILFFIKKNHKKA